MGMFDWIFGSANPTKNWLPHDDPLPVVRVDPFALATMGLGEGVESARFLGRPDVFQAFNNTAGNFELTYPRLGLRLEYELHRLSEVVFHLAGDTDSSLDDNGAKCAQIRFTDSTRLTPTTTREEVKQRFGEQPAIDEAAGEVTLRYLRGNVYMHFEFNDQRALGAWVVGLDA